MADGTLYLGTRRYSSWSLRGWLAVKLAGLDVEEVVIPIAGGATPEVARISPSARVPYLEHRGSAIWESLAICEYCAEFAPALWPEDRTARAGARSIAAEMHAGFVALRASMPMNLGRHAPGVGRTREVLADVARVEAIWRDARGRFGGAGPYLFGAEFGAADAMYAPVVTRFLTYEPELAPDSHAYCAAVRAHPLMAAWYAAAAAEPAEWRLDRYEQVG